MPEFEIELELARKADGVENMGAQERKQPLGGAESAGGQGLRAIRMVVDLGRAIGLAKIVLGAGAKETWKSIVIDPDLFVAFSPPGGGRISHGEKGPDVCAFASEVGTISYSAVTV